MPNPIDLLTGIREDLESLQFDDTTEVDRLRRRTAMVIRNTLGNDSSYLDDLDKISFHPGIWVSGMDTRPSWERGRGAFINLVDTIIEEIELFAGKEENVSPADVAGGIEAAVSGRVFVVHGHDDEMKKAVASTLAKVGLDPLILHEQPSKGRTIIEKLMDVAADASFAIVLMSPDDEARKRGDAEQPLRPRARQNVVFELGLFLGLLGRTKVVALHRVEDGFEMPSNYRGVLFVPFDKRGSWKLDMAQEMKAAGLDIDLNKLS